MSSKTSKKMDKFNRTWIIKNALEELRNYNKGDLTIRGLHYRLVSRGMTNTQQHYKRVVAAMKKVRWNKQVSFDTFSDNDRSTIGKTAFSKTTPESEVKSTINTIEYWLDTYSKNRWENQPIYPEVFIEKKALQQTFSRVCDEFSVALSPCKGYPSLTFLKKAADRFRLAKLNGKKPIMLYFGDYDPSGEDIPRSIQENLEMMGSDVEVRRVTLLKNQVIEWNLPPAPAKETDSRTHKWDGLGQVELDAVPPTKLKKLCREAIESVFDNNLYHKLLDQQESEHKVYVKQLKEYMKEKSE